MEIDFNYKPMSAHLPFHQSLAYERCLFGAFGSGKTYALCAEAIYWLLMYPGIRGLVTRKTVPELRDTTETVFVDLMPHDLYKNCEVKRSGGHIERIIFPNGSEVLFRSLDDWNKHRSLNVGFIAYDEANELDLETYQGMASRVRQRDPTAMAQAQGIKEITRRGIWSATNPSGHDWLWQRFVGPEREGNTEYFKSTSFDNPYLPPTYLESLLTYPLPWIRRYVLCDFDDFAGQIYPEWSYESHVVSAKETKDMDVFWMGMDPGTRNPTAGLWVAVDERKRRLIAVDEYQEAERPAVNHAMEWRRIERGKTVSWRVADPSIQLRDRGSNMSLADQYRRLGFRFQLGPAQHKDRIPMLGQMIALRRFVVTEKTAQTFDQIQNYRWADITPAMRSRGEDPKEIPHKANDHLVDCAQYLCSRWMRPKDLPLLDDNRSPQQKYADKVFKTIRKRELAKRQPRGAILGS